MGSVLLLLLAAAIHAGKVWHLTDVHLDPMYRVNSSWGEEPSVDSYCGSGKGSRVPKDKNHRAGLFGTPQGDCATPRLLYRSATEFMGLDRDSDIVLFTGDYTQAGLERLRGHFGVLDTIREAWETLAASLPHAAIYGAVGNHDNYPGNNYPYPYDAYYKNLSTIWGWQSTYDHPPERPASNPTRPHRPCPKHLPNPSPNSKALVDARSQSHRGGRRVLCDRGQAWSYHNFPQHQLSQRAQLLRGEAKLRACGSSSRRHAHWPRPRWSADLWVKAFYTQPHPNVTDLNTGSRLNPN